MSKLIKILIPLAQIVLQVLFTKVSAHGTDTSCWQLMPRDAYTIHYTHPDINRITQLENNFVSGYNHIVDLFNHSYPAKFDIYIFPDRISLNSQWQKDWNDPGFQSQCWMIASGVSQRLDMLSPNAWAKDACDHNGEDSVETRKVTWHEMVHVYHGQYNPDHTFNNIEKLDWLVEGIATYISGQLDEKRLNRVKQSAAADKTPSTLDDFWKGSDKYGLSGTMVGYIDKHYGRKKLFELLKFTKKQEVLDYLAVTEKELISNWKKSL